MTGASTCWYADHWLRSENCLVFEIFNARDEMTAVDLFKKKKLDCTHVGTSINVPVHIISCLIYSVVVPPSKCIKMLNINVLLKSSILNWNAE